MDFIEKWRMKLFGRGVRSFNVEESDKDGRVLVLREVGKKKRRANSLVETWDGKADEIHAQPVDFITNDHTHEPAYICQGGSTIDLWITPSKYPNREEILGRSATLDDIADAMDLNKSMKYIVIGGLVSAPVWWFLFQMIGAMMK